MQLFLPSGVVALMFLSFVATPSFSRDCSFFKAAEKTHCLRKAKKSNHKESFDKDSGAKVVNLESDLDWKNPKSAEIPWSSLIKITSRLTGDFYYKVLDRDYKINSSNGMQSGIVTSILPELLQLSTEMWCHLLI